MAAPPDRGIYLASRSPRRRELLTQIGVRFHLLLFRERADSPQDVNEDPLAGEAPDAYVERVARAKAEAGWSRMLQRNLPHAPVLSADTTVALDGRIFGKPADRADAASMLAALSGKSHEVLTAVAVKWDDALHSALSRSEVRFKDLADAEIREYVATGEADDKAGAYAIQGLASRFVPRISGSYSNVVGLPVAAVLQLCRRIGAPVAPSLLRSG
jgi:septum formation protein